MKYQKDLRFLISLLLLIPFAAFGQLESVEDLEAVSKKGFFKTHFSNMFKDFKDFGDPFTLGGGVGLNLRSYSANGGDPRQDPFFYSLNTNLNVRIYKLNLPFSLLITARNQDSSYPNLGELADAFRDNIRNQRDRFVRIGMSPRYKWATLHLGHRAMNFSRFTLANLNFYGVGAELEPGNLRLAAMYGRLAQAEPIDLSLNTPNLPVYQRVGWGVKFGYESEQAGVLFSLFESHDDVNSIGIPNSDAALPLPEENLALGLNLHQLFFEKFRFRMELGISALSPNALDEAAASSAFPEFLFTERNTTEVNTALDVSFDYEGENYTAGVQLLRVDPNYRTHGAYFFNNDIVDLLGNLGFGLLDGMINVNLSAGAQSNNLELLRPSTTRRFVYNAGVALSKNAFSASADYSNNTTDVGYVLNQGLDSLNAVFISENAGVNFSYSLSDGNSNQHAFSLGGNIQQVTDDIEDPLQSAETRLLVGQFVYNYMLTESKWRFAFRANYNQNELAQMQIDRYGVGFGVAKSLLENKMQIGLDFNHFWNTNELDQNGTNINSQLRWSYQLAEGLSANMNWGLLRTTKDNTPDFSELTGNLGIQYNFNYNPKKKKEEQEQSNN
ncbi:MAG: hypothetical protein AAGG75_06040 [Bacteroidota bacterium]